MPAGCIPIATDGGYTAENKDPDCGPVTPIDIAGWGVTVRKSVAEYEVETACACGFVFSGETPEGRQHAGFAGALAINAHVAELNGLAQCPVTGGGRQEHRHHGRLPRPLGTGPRAVRGALSQGQGPSA